MNPAGITVARRPWSSDGALLDRGFIRSLTTGGTTRRHKRVRHSARDGTAYILSWRRGLRGENFFDGTRGAKAEDAEQAPPNPFRLAGTVYRPYIGLFEAYMQADRRAAQLYHLRQRMADSTLRAREPIYPPIG
jgi:hypothetical protein